MAAAWIAHSIPVSAAQRYPEYLKAQYREFFAHFVDNRSLPERMLNAAGLSSQDYGRGFALIAGISNYPNMPGTDGNLVAASEDIRKLSNYLIAVEGFDEVVVLRDAEMTEANLSYFLQRYFPQRLRQFPKSRFLFAYSGHGATVNNKGYLLTADAQNLSDEFNAIPMATVRAMFQQIVDSGFHVLALINACYSGDFIRRPFGGERFIPKHPGQHAITAGGTNEKTWHDGSIGSGSVFFEKFFAALDGRAGKSGIVTVDDLAAYLRREVQISMDQQQNPLSGDLSRDGSLGGFFFFNRRALVDDKVLPPWDGKKGMPRTPFGPGAPPSPSPPPQNTDKSPPVPSPPKNADRPPPSPPPDDDFQKRARYAALLSQAYNLVKSREYTQAIAEYNEAIRLDPRSAKAFVGRGEAFYGARDYDRAIADHSAALQLDPKLPEALYHRSRAYVGKKDHRRALTDANDALKLDPNYAPARFSRGGIYHSMKDHGRALQEYDEAIRIDPQFNQAYNSRGVVHLDRDDYQRAMADFNKAIEIEPKAVLAITNRGRANYFMGNLDGALAEFNRALRIDPKLAGAWSARGRTYFRMENYDRAIVDFDEAIRLDPKLAVAFANRGRAHGERGNLRQARADFDKAIELDASYGQAFYYRAVNKRRTGDFAGSERDLARARQLGVNPGR